MARPTDNEINQRNKEINELFKYNSPFLSDKFQKVYSPSELKKEIYSEAINQKIINKHISFKKFIIYLKKHGIIEEARLNFPQCKVRYLYKKPSIYEVLNSFSDRAYLSHYSALCFHGLIEDNYWRNIVLSIEQTPKNTPPKRLPLTQDEIDKNFNTPYRQTNNVKEYNQHTIYLLNPSHSGNLGVKEYELKNTRDNIKVTSIERTLIDIIVNPTYSKNLHLVKKAFEAVKHIDIDAMVDYYNQLNLRYPYFQALGFMMEHTGFKHTHKEFKEGLIFNKEFKQEFDFHLTKQIPKADLAYDKDWRIFYPKSLFTD